MVLLVVLAVAGSHQPTRFTLPFLNAEQDNDIVSDVSLVRVNHGQSRMSYYSFSRPRCELWMADRWSALIHIAWEIWSCTLIRSLCWRVVCKTVSFVGRFHHPVPTVLAIETLMGVVTAPRELA